MSTSNAGNGKRIYATPAKLRTVLSLAMVRLDEAAEIAHALGMTQREQAIRTLTGKIQQQKDYVRT